MSLAVAWLLFPVVLGLLSLGCGLLIERAAGLRIQRELLLPLGFAAIVVISLCTTATSGTARLTTPIVVAVAVVGLGLAFPGRLRRVDAWPAASATAVYAAFGAPVFLSGTATFAGYIKLDDTATWLAFTDRLLDHGRNSAGLAPSTYEAAISLFFAGGYPVGAFPPLGVAHELLGIDSAWIFQPYTAFLAAMLTLGIFGLLTGVIESRPLRAIAAFVAAQPALLFGYSLWGGVKEVAAAALIVLIAALTPAVLQQGARLRSGLPIAVAIAALLGVVSFFGAIWVLPILVPALLVGIYRRGRAFLLLTVAFVAAAAALAVPTFILAGGFSKSRSTLTASNELGNLLHPLSVLQAAGIWPVGDFRLRPEDMTLTYVLVAFVAVAALAGLVWAWKRREWALVLYVAGTAASCAATVIVGSPWVDGKALAIAAPAATVAAMAAIGWLFHSGRRTEALAALLVVGGGVLWSNALAYHDVSLAKRSQLRELETIGKQFAGDGPAFMTESSPYGARHFLRNLDAESASELRRRPALLRDGTEVPKGGYEDVDQFGLDGLLIYRTLVLMHSPSASRPPSLYQRVWSGRYYEVWQRPETPANRILDHLPLGDALQPAAVPPCSAVARLGRLASADHGHLAAVARPAVTVVDLATAGLPSTWRSYNDIPGVVYPGSSGTLQATVRVATAGSYEFWLAGSFRRRLELSVDGQRVATAQDHLNHPGVDTPFGSLTLTPGNHRIALTSSAVDFSPGSGGPPLAIGPLVVSRTTSDPPVITVKPGNARSLCGKRLDWIEAVAP
jgi:hypothetical protein